MNPEALPQVGKMVPHFSLCTPEGVEVRISNFRGRDALVLMFTAGKSLGLVADLLHREEELTDESAVVLVIDAGGKANQRLQFKSSRDFRFLLDPDFHVSRRFGAEQEPAVYITDQYGEIYSAHRASEGTAPPDADEVLASLRHINAACPE